MPHALGLLLAGIAATSLALISLCSIGFLVASAVTWFARGRPDPLVGELDQFLEEILDRGEVRPACTPPRLARALAGERAIDVHGRPTENQGGGCGR